MDYRATGSRGLARLAFYEPEAEISPGAYVLTYGSSRAELRFGEGSKVILHNRCTALIENATQPRLAKYSAVSTYALILECPDRNPPPWIKTIAGRGGA